MATALHNLSDYEFDKIPDASNMCFGIVVAEWNPEITGALLKGAVDTLERHGAIDENIHVKNKRMINYNYALLCDSKIHTKLFFHRHYLAINTLYCNFAPNINKRNSI